MLAGLSQGVAGGRLRDGVRQVRLESGSLRAVHLSRHKWPGGLVNEDFGGLSESDRIILHGLGEVRRLLSSHASVQGYLALRKL